MIVLVVSRQHDPPKLLVLASCYLCRSSELDPNQRLFRNQNLNLPRKGIYDLRKQSDAIVQARERHGA
eukprot:2578346-Rhodomonas_salina.2